MLKVTNRVGSSAGRSNTVGVIAPKKRGRPPKVRPTTLETMKTNDDPDMRFIRDLAVSDRTEILEGKEDGFRYRWCEESKVRTRESQGYSKADDGVKTHFDGNYMPAEGYDARKANKGGLVLMKIPETLGKKRDAIKAEKVEAQSRSMEAQHVNSMRDAGGEVLGANDSFVGDMANGD